MLRMAAYFGLLVKKDDLLRANPKQLFSGSTFLEASAAWHTDVEECAVITRVALATLNVEML